MSDIFAFEGSGFAVATAQLIGLIFDRDLFVVKSRWQNERLMSLMN